MAGPERTLRARGRKRKDELLDAAISVIAERGIGGVTHRAVAERAGVPVASTTYFFDSLDELIGEALTTMMARELERLAAFRESVAGLSRGQVVDAFVETVRENPSANDIAQYEAYLFASRNPQLQGRVAAMLESTHEAAAQILATHGISDPAAAVAVTALLDGFALARLAHPQADGFGVLNRTLRALIIGFSALDIIEDGGASASKT
jgi:DNA-binding transcriptional regulator YbjK